MTQRIKIGQLTVDVFFSSYDKLTKKRTQIPGHDLTRYDLQAINRGLDDTDFGEFYHYSDSEKEITGAFSVVDTDQDE
jgi:hypothetical protein